MNEDRIKKIDEKNDHTECLLCVKDESTEHVMLCNSSMKTREDWSMSMTCKFQAVAKKRNTAANENKIIEQMENNVEKCFSN